MSTTPLTKRAPALGAGILAAIAVAVAPASAAAKDRNHDRIPDRWEVRHDLSLKHDQANRDQDRDDLDNLGEFEANTDPRNDDSDADGVEDGDEGAGTIASFDAASGKLVIDAFSGDTVTGTVTPDTEIECNNDDDVQPDEQGDDGPNSGPGNADDDNDDVGDDTGDDNGDDGPGDDAGDDNGDSGHGGPGHGRSRHGDDGENCSAADLTAGTVVREAELELTASGPVFEEIEL